jgi:putative phage-type endonuclease
VTADRDLWLAERRKGIGSSDAAACCNLSPWGTPLHVYRDKLGLSLPKSSWEMEQGLNLEPLVAALYTQETGRELAICEHTQHPSIPWLLASPDRLARDRLVELKTTGFAKRGEDGWGEAGSDEVPPVYLCQAQHQMLVSGIDLCDIALVVGQDVRVVDTPQGMVLIGVQDFRIYSVPFSREFCERMFAAEESVWRMVERQEPPEPDWSHPATADLMMRYKPAKGISRELTPEVGVMAAQYRMLSEGIAQAEKQQKAMKAKLSAAMGDAELGILPCGYTIERKLVTRASYVAKESQYFTLTVKEPKNDERIS